MALTDISIPSGITNGVALSSANLNAALVDEFQANIDNYKTIDQLIPLVWDITTAPTVTNVNTLSATNIPPGIVYVDMSAPVIAAGQTVTLGFDSTIGPRLIVPLNNDEAPDAQIHIACNGYMVNNSSAADLPTPNQFRIHSIGATLVGATANRLFCKDGFYFHLILNELEANISILNQLSTAEAEYIQLQADLDSSILNFIDPVQDAQADSLLDNLDSQRRNAMYWAMDRMNANAGRTNLFDHAQWSTLTDLSSTTPTVDIPMNFDMMKYILVIPNNANAESINFRLVNGIGHPQDTFSNILVSVNIVARKAIPFNVDIDPLTGLNASFNSDHEELVIFSKFNGVGINIAEMVFL